jgi:hypothetical protein
MQNKEYKTLASSLLARRGKAALTTACEYQPNQVIRELLKLGCSTKHTDTYGRTALNIMCAYNKSEDIILKLLDLDCNPNQADQQGETAISWAAFKNKPKVVKKLVELGCEYNSSDTYGYSAFDYTCWNYLIKPDRYTQRNLFVMCGLPDPSKCLIDRISTFRNQLRNSDEDLRNTIDLTLFESTQKRADIDKIKTKLAGIVKLRGVFRQWAMRSTIGRILPQGPDRIVYGYL